MAMAGFGSSATGSSTGLRNVENQDDFDRISNLPEHLRSQILSLLTTKEAVASSILSKRWRFLWTTITTIDIDFGYKIVSPAFLDSVMNSVLLQRSMPSIHKFSLKVAEFTDESLINQWISAVGRRSVKHIKLSINNYHVRCHTVRGLFDCKNLEVLILFGSGILFDIPKELSICFPALKVLYLMGVRYGEISKKEGSICCFPVLHTLYLWSGNYLQNDDTVNKLLRECPVLEVLHSIGDNLSNIQICSLSLRRFELNLQYPRTAVCKVEIDAPMLQYVTIIGLGEKLILKQIPYSLVEATILVNGRNLWDDILIRSIPPPVDYVKYQAITNAVIGSTSQDPPLFCNLNRLEVTLWCRHMSYLQCFLERSVNLQYLVIQKVLASCKSPLLILQDCLI